MIYTWYELLWMFLIYSFAGWCAEVSMAALKRKRLIFRGYLNAPFCLIYGTGAVAFALFLPELKDSLFFLFLGGIVIASFIEYVTGHVLERIFQQKWWDYSGQKYHINGYISLTYSLVWGICAVLMVKYGNPLLVWLFHLMPLWLGRIVVLGVSALLILDGISVSASILQMHRKLKRLTDVAEEWQVSENWQKISQSLGNALTRRIQGRIMKAYPNISVEHLAGKLLKKEKSGVFAEGCSFYKLVSLFFIGAFLGDIIETIFCYVTSGVLMSRSSVVYGPFSIIWGLGCVLLTAILYQYRGKNDRYIFLAGTILGGAYEYICSVFTELVFGTVFWDYSKIPFNLGGRINLLYCFFWGIVAVVWLNLIYPRLSDLIEKIPRKWGLIGSNLLIVFMIFNMLVSGLAMARYTARNTGTASDSAIGIYMDEHFPDERMERIYPNAKIVD